MQLMRLAEVTTTERERIFAYSRSRALLGAIILLIAAVTAAVLSWVNHFWLGYYLAAVYLAVILNFQKDAQRALPTIQLARPAH